MGGPVKYGEGTVSMEAKLMHCWPKLTGEVKNQRIWDHGKNLRLKRSTTQYLGVVACG